MAAAASSCFCPIPLLLSSCSCVLLLLILLFLSSSDLVTVYNEDIFSDQIPTIESENSTAYKRSENYHATVLKKLSNLDKIEVDLAQARATILYAIQSQNYSFEGQQTFVSRGSIYRNPNAFYRSHMEMVKRFKVWTYREGEQPLVHMGPMKHIYGIEGQFISEMESQNCSFRAQHPDEAHAFFLPFSVAGVVDYVYQPITTMEDYSRDRLHRFVKDYVHTIAGKHPYWNRTHGADHFMVSCHDWAPEISQADPQLFKNFIRVLCNANTSEGFRPSRDVSMPDIYVPPDKLRPPDLAQSPKNRPILAFFSGGEHGYIREILLKQWKNKDNDIQVHEYLPKGQNYTKLLGKSKYCLCPSGYEVASPRIVEAIIAGCIPVIISKNYSLPFSDVLNWNQFSVKIPVEKIPEIKNILGGISETKYLRMHGRVKMVRKHFVLNRPAEPFDVIHMVLHSVWLRRLNILLNTQY